MRTLIGNLYGGLVAAVIALPLSIAFGMASGLGATAGLYGAIFTGFFAAAFGGTKTQITGPTGPMTVVVATVVATMSTSLSQIFATFLLAGLFQIVFGLFRIGNTVRFIPYPVISGFMNGVGIIIIILQLNVAMGVDPASSILQTLKQLPQTLVHLDMMSLMLSLASLIIVFFTPMRITRLVPSPLIALLLLSFVAYFLHLDVAHVSDIPSGLPQFIMPHFSLDDLHFMLTSALTLAVLGSIDSLLTSLVADSITRDRHNSNRELIGQGIGNAMASLFGGIPGAGATMRTVINIKSGGNNRLSGMIHALVLLLILLVLAPLAEHIPLAVLSGILIKVGLDILDYRMLRHLKSAPRHDLSVMASVFFLTVFVDLIVAVGIGVVLACVLIIHRLTQESSVDIVPVICPVESEEDRITDEGIRVINITGAFFFGSTSRIIEAVEKVYDVHSVIIDCSRVPFMDLSAVYALGDTIAKLKQLNSKVFVVADVKRKQKLLALGIGDVLQPQGIYETQDAALDAARA